MSDPLELLYPDLDQESRKLKRKQAYANALLQQGQGGYSGPGSGLREAGSSILGALLARRADKQEGDLAKQRSAMLAQMLGGSGGLGGAGGGQVSNTPQYVPGQPDLDTASVGAPAAPQVSNTGGAMPGGGSDQTRRLALALALSGGDPKGLLEAQNYQTPDEQQARAMALKAAPGPVPQPGAPLSPEAFSQQQQLRAPQPTAPLSPEAFSQQQQLRAPQSEPPKSPERQQQDIDAAVKAAEARAGSTGGNVQSVQQIQLDDGRAGLLTVYRSGQREVTTIDGKPVVSSARDPNALFNQGAARQGGMNAGTAAEAFPVVQANYDIIKKSLDAFNDPAVKKEAPYSIGYGSLLPNAPGYNTQFRAMRDQLKGQAFLQAFNALKGGGQITEVEGQKATDAIVRLNSANTPEEFYKALDDARGTFSTLFDAAKQRAGRGATVPQLKTQQAQPSPADIDAELRRRGVIK